MQFIRLSVFLMLYWASLSSAAPLGRPITIGFDGLGDLSIPQTELGVTFSGATVLACGESLNCTAFPPASGRNVIYDQPGFGGAITATFDFAVTGFVSAVSARITGNRAITMTAFNRDGGVIASATTGGANHVGSGGTPNKLLTVESSDRAISIAKVVIQDSGNTFTVDDFTFYSQTVKVILDAGHGYILKSDGTHNYQRAPSTNLKIIEDLLTLEMALTTEMILMKSDVPGLQIVQTRRDEAAPFAPVDCKPKGSTVCPADVSARKRFAETEKADIFVSIHTNAGPPLAHGTESFWINTGKSAENSSRSREFAEELHNKVVAQLGTRPRQAKKQLVALVQAVYMPASLIEVAFHSNTTLASDQTVTDETLLADTRYRSAAAQAIADAIIVMVRKLSGQGTPP